MSGSLVLHAAAIAFGSGVWLVLGDSGAGKSSLTAAFSLDGWPILSDDCCVLDISSGERARAFPSYPRIRLWRGTASYFFGEERASGEEYAHYTTKRLYELPGHSPVPPGDIAGALTLSYGSLPSANDYVMQPLTGHSAVAVLMQGAKNFGTLVPATQTAGQVMNLATKAPVFELRLHDDIFRLGRVSHRLARDLG
jgi:hypothetical protein